MDLCVNSETMNKVPSGRYGAICLRNVITFKCHRNVFHVNKSSWTLHKESFRVWATCNVKYLNFLVKKRILFFQQHSLDHLSVFGADRAVQLPGLQSTETTIRTSLHSTIERQCERACNTLTSIPALLFQADCMNCSWAKHPSSILLQKNQQRT